MIDTTTSESYAVSFKRFAFSQSVLAERAKLIADAVLKYKLDDADRNLWTNGFRNFSDIEIASFYVTVSYRQPWTEGEITYLTFSAEDLDRSPEENVRLAFELSWDEAIVENKKFDEGNIKDKEERERCEREEYWRLKTKFEGGDS